MARITFAEVRMTSLPETRPSLLLRLREGRDQQAWTTFLEIYQPLIYRLCRQRQIQDADAREVTQDVLLAVAGAIDRWQTDPARGSFHGWLATITRNLVVNLLIKQARSPRASGDSQIRDALEAIPAPEADQTALFDLEERRQTFRWAADRVRAEFRDTHWQAFWLTAVDALTPAAAAAELGISVGLVYVARNRVMARLRETVEQLNAK